ncbi:hypothetical protein ACFXKJ_01900 [Kitasatospora indigofera]|uniref:hypothetical protein n=1 Tax=Kitasatospora indigofera TaxID=67307 RepID=UPI0036977B26
MPDETAPTQQTEQSWSKVDPLIFEGRRIQALIQIRAAFDVGLHDGVDLLRERYETLRAERPENFKVEHDDYWDGFGSL